MAIPPRRGPALPLVGGKVGPREMNTDHPVQTLGPTRASQPAIALPTVGVATVLGWPDMAAGIPVPAGGFATVPASVPA